MPPTEDEEETFLVSLYFEPGNGVHLPGSAKLFMSLPAAVNELHSCLISIMFDNFQHVFDQEIKENKYRLFYVNKQVSMIKSVELNDVSKVGIKSARSRIELQQIVNWVRVLRQTGVAPPPIILQ